jgi:radical SAM superfamily enzyme YgiQ (UPF0313 family)
MKKASKNILLVHTPCPQLEEDNLDPPMGLLYIAAVVDRAGYQVEILDLSSIALEECIQLLEKKVSHFTYIGFSTYTSNYSLTLRLLDCVKRKNSAIIAIAGGPHATALYNDVAKHFDYIVCGEGEKGILQVIERPSQKIIHADPVMDLNTLPLPAYHLVDLNKYTRMVDGCKAISILSTRGCPHQCVFCNSIIFPKKCFRVREPSEVAKEINYLIQNHGINSIKFNDDLFTVDAERIKKIFALVPSIVYRCFARVDTLTSKMCSVLRQTGCKHISVGIESGSEVILKLMNKGETKEIMYRGLMNAKKEGLIIRIYLIVGFPGETDKTISETIDFLQSIPFDEFVVYPLIPYPGTRLLSESDRFGITEINRDYDKYIQIGKKRFSGFLFRTKTFNETDIERWRNQLISFIETKLDKSWSSSKSSYK